MMKEGKVLVLSGVKGDTQRYRSFHTYEQLRLAGIDCSLSHITDRLLPQLIDQAGLVIFHRVVFDSYVDRLIRRIRERNAFLLVDIDDLIFLPEAFQWIDSPDFADPIRARLYQEDMRRLRKTLDYADGVLASTNFLAEKIRSFDKPTWIHRNAFNLVMLERSELAFSQHIPDRDRIVIGYASGTATHNRDFALVKPVLQMCLQKYPQTELWLVGPLDVGNGWTEFSGRIKQFSLVPWRELPFLQAKFSINLAPLVLDNPFSNSKSEIKFVEAGLVRVPTVASCSDSYSFAIRSGENGFLASNESEWMDALQRLIENKDYRQSVGERAYQDIFQQYHPSVRAQDLLVTLRQIFETLPSQNGSFSIKLDPDKKPLSEKTSQEIWAKIGEVEQHPTLVDLAYYSFKHRGLTTLLKRVWIFLRRLTIPIYKETR